MSLIGLFTTHLKSQRRAFIPIVFLIHMMSNDNCLNADPSQSAGGISGGSQSTASNNLIIQKLRSLKSSVNNSLDQISAWVDRLSETVYGSSATQRSMPAESSSCSWANRTRSPPTVLISLVGRWGRHREWCGLVDLSEANHRLVKNVFLASMPNGERRRLRNQFPTFTVSGSTVHITTLTLFIMHATIKQHN